MANPTPSKALSQRIAKIKTLMQLRDQLAEQRVNVGGIDAAIASSFGPGAVEIDGDLVIQCRELINVRKLMGGKAIDTKGIDWDLEHKPKVEHAGKKPKLEAVSETSKLVRATQEPDAPQVARIPVEEQMIRCLASYANNRNTYMNSFRKISAGRASSRKLAKFREWRDEMRRTLDPQEDDRIEMQEALRVARQAMVQVIKHSQNAMLNKEGDASTSGTQKRSHDGVPK